MSVLSFLSQLQVFPTNFRAQLFSCRLGRRSAPLKHAPWSLSSEIKFPYIPAQCALSFFQFFSPLLERQIVEVRVWVCVGVAIRVSVRVRILAFLFSLTLRSFSFSNASSLSSNTIFSSRAHLFYKYNKIRQKTNSTSNKDTVP